MIPNWRPVTTTPQIPGPKPTPEVRAQVQAKVKSEPFVHFSNTLINKRWYLKIVDAEYYARFGLITPFTGPMYMTISIITADQWPAGLPLANLFGALQSLGLGVAVAYIDGYTVDIYTWSNRPLSAVQSDILGAINRNTPNDVTLNAVYYIVGDNIMVWDQFIWDSGRVWANDPTLVYP